MAEYLRFGAGSDSIIVTINGPGAEKLAQGVRKAFQPYDGSIHRPALIDAAKAIEVFLSNAECLVDVQRSIQPTNGGISLSVRIQAASPQLSEPLHEAKTES